MIRQQFENSINVHNRGLPRAVSSNQTGYLALAELQGEILDGDDVSPFGVIHLPDTLEFHADLLLRDRQGTEIALVVCTVRQQTAIRFYIKFMTMTPVGLKASSLLRSRRYNIVGKASSKIIFEEKSNFHIHTNKYEYLTYI